LYVRYHAQGPSCGTMNLANKQLGISVFYRYAMQLDDKRISVSLATVEFRPAGGIYHYGLQPAGGPAMWGKWEFREIVAPERIVLIQCFSDEQGGVARHPYAPDWPQYTLSTMTFGEQGLKTMFSLTWAPHNATEAERNTLDAGRADGAKLGRHDGTAHRLSGEAASG